MTYRRRVLVLNIAALTVWAMGMAVGIFLAALGSLMDGVLIGRLLDPIEGRLRPLVVDLMWAIAGFGFLIMLFYAFFISPKYAGAVYVFIALVTLPLWGVMPNIALICIGIALILSAEVKTAE